LDLSNTGHKGRIRSRSRARSRLRGKNTGCGTAALGKKKLDLLFENH
jgi:hypothetical protein